MSTFVLQRIKLSALQFDPRNPRDLPEERRYLLELSLRKYGLLSPVYVNRKGLILSGHQRLRILFALGYKHTYGVIVDDLPTEEMQGAVNMVFNKELQNVVDDEEIPDTVEDLVAQLEALPDLDDIYTPLRNLEIRKFSELQIPAVAHKQLSPARMLWQKTRTIIPLIIDESGNIQNGAGRAHYYRTKFESVPCIVVTKELGRIFRAASAVYKMDAAKDIIRIGQRRHIVTHRLAGVWGKPLVGAKLNKGNIAYVNKFLVRKYPRMFDFGSGNGKQTTYLRAFGADITLFEPFAVGGNTMDLSLKETYDNINMALDSIGKLEPYDLVTANAVLNSVPFEDDRDKVVTLLKFLSYGAKTLILSSRNPYSYQIHKSESTTFRTNDMGENKQVSTGIKVKIQTFYSEEDLKGIFGTTSVTSTKGKYSFCRIDNPKYYVDKDTLLDAVRFEFSIKYKDRTFTDLTNKALDVFSKRYDWMISQGYTNCTPIGE